MKSRNRTTSRAKLLDKEPWPAPELSVAGQLARLRWLVGYALLPHRYVSPLSGSWEACWPPMVRMLPLVRYTHEPAR
ncbi:hypothetical protein BUUB107078_01005 [Burkholderia ubonensis]|nr:hypothetical protein BUB20358_04016 [Burkholderia ubonensis]